MAKLRERGLVEVLNERALEAKVPVLGICLGGQLIGRGSEEGSSEGLGWVAMDTVAFDRGRLSDDQRVPHMGWADTASTGHPLFESQDDPRFYYVHSYHFSVDEPGDVIATAEHGYRFATGVARGNIMGVQFHPEKSHAFGLKLLKTFATMSFPK
jgi:glutamine amidotransferase